jgi:hypothetical protein
MSLSGVVIGGHCGVGSPYAIRITRDAIRTLVLSAFILSYVEGVEWVAISKLFSPEIYFGVFFCFPVAIYIAGA